LQSIRIFGKSKPPEMTTLQERVQRAIREDVARQDLAAAHPNVRVASTNGKAEFIRRITALALTRTSRRDQELKPNGISETHE